jgi:Rieske Fe-S protein
MTKKIYSFITLTFLLLSTSILLSTCGDRNNNYQDIPDVYVHYTINLDLPSFNALNIPGGHVVLPDEGFKGVIVYHNIDGNFYAFEATCTHHPLADCSQITVDESGIYMRCGHYEDKDFIKCCESTYDMNGYVLNPPALYPLKQYTVYQQGRILTVSN